MESILEDTNEMCTVLLEEVLYGIDLDPRDFQTLTSYLGETHDHAALERLASWTLKRDLLSEISTLP